MKNNILLRTLFRGTLGGGASVALLIAASFLLAPAPQARALDAAIGGLIDMNGSALGWTTGGYGSEDLWQRGVPTFGPTDGRVCWGTVLEGRYPDSADGWLVSPELTIRGRTTLSFATWFDIDNTAWTNSAAMASGNEFDDGYKGYLDSGRVEISIENAGWANITSAATIPGNTASEVVAGTSGGWVTATVPLPDEAVGKTVRIRFRFASDANRQGLGNPAGWFIDDVALLPSGDDGIVLLSATVEDSATGNANDLVEPGESVWVAFTVANQGDTDHAGVVGSVRCSTPGVTLTESPAAVTYGDIAAGANADGAPRLLVSIADSVAPGTVVRLSQSISDSEGETWDAEASFLVVAAASWSGTVRESTSAGSSTASVGARVALVSDVGDYSTATVSSGAFSFPAIPAGTYAITVSKDGFVDYGPASVEVIDGGRFSVTLGVAYAVVDPESIHIDLAGTSSSATGAFALRNGTDEKPGTEPLSFMVSFPDGQPAWLEWDVFKGTVSAPESGAPIPEVALPFTVYGKGLLDDPRTSATVRITSNDCDGNDTKDIEITLTCAGFTDAVTRLSVTDFGSSDDPEGTSDADGFLEKGEEGVIWFTLRNETDADLENLVVESVVAIDGSDGSDFANVVVDTEGAAISGIAAYGSGTTPELPITVPDSADPDPWYAFELTIRDPASGLASVTTNIVTLFDRHSVAGTVYKATARFGTFSNAVLRITRYTAPEELPLDLDNLPDPDEGYPVDEVVDPATPADVADLPRIEAEVSVVTNMEAWAAAIDAGFDPEDPDPETLATLVSVETNAIIITELRMLRASYQTNVVVTLFYKDAHNSWTIRGGATTLVNPETDANGYREKAPNQTRWLIGEDGDGNPIYAKHHDFGTAEALFHVQESTNAQTGDTTLVVTPYYKDDNGEFTIQGVPTTYANAEGPRWLVDTDGEGNPVYVWDGKTETVEGDVEVRYTVTVETDPETGATNVVATAYTLDDNSEFTVEGDSTTYENPLRCWPVGEDDDGNPVYVWDGQIGTVDVLYDIKSNVKTPRTGYFLDIEPVSGALVNGLGAFDSAEPATTAADGTYALHGLRNGFGKIYATPPEGASGILTGYVMTNGVLVAEYEDSSVPVLFANLPDGLPEMLDFYLVGTADSAALDLVDIAISDANGDGVFEPGETFDITGILSNAGDTAAAAVSVEFLCLFPEGEDASSWPSATFPESPLEEPLSIAPGEQAEFGLEGNVFGDIEGIATVLVKITSVTAAGTTHVTWGTFDLISTITYAGTVFVDDEPFGGARLFFEVLDAGGNVLSSRIATSYAPADGSAEGLGTYSFQYSGDVNRAVRIRVQPSAEFLPANLVIDVPAPQGGVRSDLDFHLTGTGVDSDGAPTGTGALAVTLDGSDDLAVTHPEGASTNLVLTIANNGDEPMTVTGVSVRYVREIREYGQGVPRRRGLLRAAASPAEEESPDGQAESPDGQAESPDGQAVLDLSSAVPGECFVTFRSGLSAEEQEALLAPLGVTVARRFTLIRAVHCRYDAGADFLALRAALLATGGVLKVEPVRTLHLEPNAVFTDGLVDDPRADAQWAICNEGQTGGSWGADIDVVPLWEKGLVGSRDVIVAVMDSGVDIDHPDLIPNLWVNPGEIPDNGIDDDGNGYVDDVHGWNFALGTNDVDDPANMKSVGHGTHCAGIIGAVGNNALGIVGVSQRVRILPIRISDDNGALSASDADCAAAFEYLVACGASVVNCSWGHDLFFSDPILTEAIQNASDAGLLVCIAASNEAKNNDAYRLSIAGLRATANVIVVAAADHDDKIAEFSDFGADLVDIAAPGVDILSTMPEEMGPLWESAGISPVANHYVLMDGTSMATPYVAGAAGLLKAIAPGASMQDIRRAILDGARRDPNLQGWVSTSGHLDIARAAALLGSDWLVPTTDLSEGLAIAPGDTAEIAFDVNPALRLVAGEYGAIADIDYVYGDNVATFGAAVTDTVTAAPFVTVSSVVVNDAANGDGDGYADPGETAGIVLTLRNDGSLRLTDVQGTVSGANGSWGLLASGGSASNAVPVQVAMPEAEGDAEFTLELSATAPDGSPVALSVPFTVPVAARASVTGTVKNAAGKGVAGAIVEFWTDGIYAASAFGLLNDDYLPIVPESEAERPAFAPKLAGRVVANASGAYRVDGLPPGAHVALRAIPAGYARSVVSECDVSGSGATTVNLSVGDADIGFPDLSEDGFEVTLLPGAHKSFSLAVTNTSSSAISYRAVAIARKRVLLLSDRDSLSALAPEIAKLGFDVDVLTDNYEFVNVDYGNYTFQNEEHVVYSKDPATFANYDFVIADFDGDRQGGRQITEEEETALRDYLGRGGRVLVTGGSLLAMPDNDRLASLVGASDCRRRTASATAPAAFADSAALPTWTLPGKGETTFAEVASTQPTGAFLPGGDSEADAFAIDSSATVLSELAFIGDDGAPAVSPKILRREIGSGALYYWGGNSGASDIAGRGVLQDVLRDILYGELFEPVSWITIPSSGSFTAKRRTSLSVTARSASLDLGDYVASVVFFNETAGSPNAFIDAETVSVPVTVHVALPAFTAYTTLGVTNALGNPLKGDGQPGSCVFQLIATTDASGVISAPRATDGMPSGGETVLASATSGLYFGRFGDTAADQGLFRDTFDIPMADRALWVVVRAWNGPEVGRAIWYGDSAPYKLTREEGESHDFGQWGVGTVFNYPAEDGTLPLDSNGDGIPDGYVIENFPGMDPTLSPVAETDSEFLQKIQDDAVHTPYRVFATDRYVYALCENGPQWGISVWTTNGLNGTLVGTFTLTGVQSPRGMGRQPGANRLAIADTGNNAVLVFEFDETKIAKGNVQGAFTLVTTIASAASGDEAAFDKPLGVAMDAQGSVYVLDSGDGNALPGRRVVVFNADGTFRRAIQPTGASDLRGPAGIGVDSVTGDIYVANTSAGNIVRISESGGDFIAYGFIDGEQLFREPTDVKVWRVGSTFRLLVADRGANAVHVLDSEGGWVATFANAQDATIHVLDGNFYSPWGVYPIDDTDELWVADTQNNRLQHLRFSLDGDGDGIDDTQEMLAGLDPVLANDPDTDGDGLADSAEILLGTDPNDPDTDDGGVNDGDEVAAGLDPLDASDDASAQVDLTVVALPAEGGVVAGSGSFLIGASAEISATPAEGWQFAGWQDDGSTDSPRTVKVAAAGNAYTALFERETHLVVVNFVTTNGTPSEIVEGGTQTHSTYYGISFLQDDRPLFVAPYAFLEGSDSLEKTYAQPIIEFADGTTTNVTVTFVVDGDVETPPTPPTPPTPDEPVPPAITATAIGVNGATLTAAFTTDATEEAQYGTYMNDERTATTLVAVGTLADLADFRAWRAANPDAARSDYTGNVVEFSATVTATSAAAPFTFSIEADLSSWSGDSLFLVGFDKP